jgi:3-deoxy-7-phosphoheptulonate synthase
LWIGERTNSINEAHVEFFRGIENPIGIKISTRSNFDDLVKMITILNPKNKPGKIILITRFGCDYVLNYLETLCKKIIENSLKVIFVCDPNHGNTKVDEISKKKVRYFEELKNEIILTNKILQNNNLFLSGIHLEGSSYHVTECFGGIENEVNEITEDSYTTYCDPRLNIQQVKL